METFGVNIEIGNYETGKSLRLVARIDTKRTHTFLPSDMFNQLGIEIIRQQLFKLTDKRMVQHDVGAARLSLQGRQTIASVVSTKDESSLILGTMALDSLGLGVDSASQQLIDVPLLLLTPILIEDDEHPAN